MKKIKQEFYNLSPGVKSSIAFAFASMISAGMSYLTTPIFTRILSPNEYGQVTVFLTWQSVFGIIAMFSLNYGVFNNGMMDYPDDRDRFSFSILGLSNVITLIFGSLIFLVKFCNDKVINIEYQYLGIMFLIFLVQPAYNFWIARQRYEYKYKAAFIVSIIIAMLAPIVSIFLVLFINENKVAARIFGLESTLLLIYGLFYILLAKKNNFKFNCQYWKYAFLFNLPLLPHYLSTYILSGSDRIMISYLVNDTATGYYSVSYSIASLGIIIWTAINGSLIPYTYQKCKDKKYKELNKVINIILSIIFICCVTIIFIAPEIIAFFAAREYASGVVIVPAVVAGIFFQIQYSLYANVLYYYRKPKWVMIASVSSAIINIIANYIFIKRFGYIAAAYTTLICYLMQACLDYFAMKHVVKDNIYDMKFITICSSVMIGIAIIIPFTYKNWIFRYIILSILIIFVFFFRKKIKEIVKSLMSVNLINHTEKKEKKDE